MNKLMLAIARAARRVRLRVALRSVEIPLRATSALTWRLESARTLLRTKVALEEANR